MTLATRKRELHVQNRTYDRYPQGRRESRNSSDATLIDFVELVLLCGVLTGKFLFFIPSSSPQVKAIVVV